MPGIEAKLQPRCSLRLAGLPDVQVGIVHVKTDRHLAAMSALVSRVAIARVGVSARFDDLRDTARALRQARVALRGRADPGSPVSVFDGSILATAAVSAPEVMVELASPVMSVSRILPTKSGRYCSRRFECGGTTMGRCAPLGSCCSVTPIPSAIACTASSSAPAVP